MQSHRPAGSDLSPADFVDLDRRFRSHDRFDNDSWWEILAAEKQQRDWDWLLSHRVVALLAEAGSGKTYEFRAQADRLNAAGRPAFYWPIQRLLRPGLDTLFASERQRRLFSDWSARRDEAVFFLDSVDEAKLPARESAAPLQDALARFQSLVGKGLPHCRVVISCRGSEWFQQTEQSHVDAFVAHLASLAPAGESDADTLFRKLSFAALDRGRVQTIAAATGDADAFLAMLDEEQLWEEVRTPMDAVHYAAVFTDAGGDAAKLERLKSRTAVLESSVRRRLADVPDARSRVDLAPDLAFSAVCQLAFAAVVLQTRDISFEQPVDDALDAAELLALGPHSLSPQQRRQLLVTPLFTPAGSGSVAFYRPEVTAMLAARFLEDHMALLTPQRVLSTFISKPFDIAFVPQQYGPMLAWLAARDERVLRVMLDIAPEYLIEDGDPRAIAIGDRISALRRHVTDTHEHLPGSFYFPNEALRRFAEPALEPEVVALLEASQQNEGQIHLLQMARMGKFAGAADFAEQLTANAATPAEYRIYAVRALAACGTAAHLRRAAEALASRDAPSATGRMSDIVHRREDDVRVQLAVAAYPGAIGLETLLTLLGQARGREYTSDSAALAAIAERAPEADLEALVLGLESLCWGERPRTIFSHRGPKHTKRTRLMFDALCSAVGRLIAFAPDRVRIESIDWCFTGSMYSRLDRDHVIWPKILDALRGAPDVRRRMIAGAIALKLEGKPDDALFNLGRRLDRIWGGDEVALQADIETVLAGYRAASRSDREDWSELLIRWMAPVRRPQIRLPLARAALSHAAGIDWPTLAEMRWQPFLPVRRFWFRNKYKFADGYYLKRRARDLKEAVHEKYAFARRLAGGWRKLATGQPAILLFALVHGDNFDRVEQAEILRRYGRVVGPRIVEGTKNVPRYMIPGISYTYWYRFLLETGLRWRQESDRAFPQGLDEAVRRAAFQMVLDESDESGPWFEALIRSDPALWSATAAAFVIANLDHRARFEPEFSSTRLRTLAHLPDALVAPLAAPLLQWTEQHPAIAETDIAPVADVVDRAPDLRPRLAALARRGTHEAFREGRIKRALAWLVIWARYDRAAIVQLCDWLETIWSGDEFAAHHGLMAIGSMLGRDYRDEPVRVSGLPASDRLRLAMIVHRLVRAAEDEPGHDGVQEHTPRRQREDVRRAADNYLDADHSAEGRAALLTLTRTLIEPSYPEWAQRWEASHARDAGTPRPWTVADVRRFIERGTLAPATGDAALARVAEEIDDIRTMMTVSEFDRRGLFTEDTDETDVRAWLGHELSSRIAHWASITQETVTQGEKRSDLRIELRSGDTAVIVVEIKLAHRWDRHELVSKVETQLARQYLIGDPRVRHGLYLVVDFGFALRGKLADGSAPDIAAVMTEIEKRAAALNAPGQIHIGARFFGFPAKRKPAKRKKSGSKAGGATGLPDAS